MAELEQYNLPQPAPEYITKNDAINIINSVLSNYAGQLRLVSGNIAIKGDDITTSFGDNGNFIKDVINAKLDTDSKKILSDFDFGTTNYAGAVKSGDITWNTTTGAITGGSGVVVYRKGIVGAASGVATFTLDATTGNATFAGTLSAASGTLGAITIGTNAWHVDSSGNMWWGSHASYAAASIKISSAGSIDFTTGNFSGNLSAPSGTLGAITAGTFTGTTIQTASTGRRLKLDGSTTNYLQMLNNDTSLATMGIDTDDNVKLSSVSSDIEMRVPSSRSWGFFVNGTREVQMDGDGDILPRTDNVNRVGNATTRWGDIYVTTLHEGCLWLDEYDDLAILNACKPRKDIKGNIIRNEKGQAKLDTYSLPDWIHDEKNIRDEIAIKKPLLEKQLVEIDEKISNSKRKDLPALKNYKKTLEEEYSNYNLTEEEIVDRTGRNLGAFVDVIAGAVRQLDKRLTLIESNV